MTEQRVIVDALNIDYPAARVVNNLSFTLGNERLALVGESGSGKSMSARALVGLVRKPGIVSANRLNVLGNDLLTLSTRRWQALRGNGIAMVLQDPRYPGELSGGMGQRVMIAIALINNPQVLIADEPTSALDARLRNQILELLVQQSEERQMAMLLISHDLPLVAEHCDRVLVMYQGEKVDEMAASRLPQATHPYTRTLWTCRPNAQTFGQMLPTLDRTQPWKEADNGAR